MHVVSSAELRTLIEDAGWRILHWRDRRADSLPSVQIWHRRLQDIVPTGDRHLETLRAFCRRVLMFPEEWGACNPLIEVVAE